MSASVLRIAVLGLGEAGGEIARDLVAAGADVRGYDPKVTPHDTVIARADEADAVRDADLVLQRQQLARRADALVARAARACVPAPSGRTSTPPSPGVKASLVEAGRAATSPSSTSR